MNVDPLECNIVKNCAATLAGLGTAGIFNADCPDPLCLEERLDQLNQRLSPKGVKAEVLFSRKNTALIYVYRPSRLARCLEEPEARELLFRYGYVDAGMSDSLEHLRERFRESSGFPHEIGIFLGYPAYDVRQFIENNGRNYLCCGTWKVYSQEEKARCFFARVRKCTEIYRKALENGMSIDRLTVSVRKSW
ncbi:DUF3793 family protein [Clostridiales Family XIII bacterium RF-744-FAT-WT-3]|uniref:DUF3793 family protein n=1 Tax=Baileyella intestinalis TaxID=2606709 RepID=A0A6A8MBX2_9FIRM|nr:DUF3793 family protein [Baileyella intestinalis]MST68826.1 DUF3793 family protein [Baileyella intestinalis]